MIFLISMNHAHETRLDLAVMDFEKGVANWSHVKTLYQITWLDKCLVSRGKILGIVYQTALTFVSTKSIINVMLLFFSEFNLFIH